MLVIAAGLPHSREGLPLFSAIQEELYPSIYQTDEPLQKQKWNLSEQEDSIFGYLCRAAEAKYRGKNWKAYYTEEVPASIGPWKLGGLPGMITKVEDEEGIHSFTLCGLLNEEQPLIFTEYLNWFVPQMNSGKMSMARQRIDYQKMTAKKFLKHKKNTIIGIELIVDAAKIKFFLPTDPDCEYIFIKATCKVKNSDSTSLFK